MNKKLLLFIVVVVLAGGITGALYLLKKKNSSPTVNQTTNESSDLTSTQIPGVTISPVTSTEQIKKFTDSQDDDDRDGIVDTKEKELGLSDSQFDTDRDGLSDYNEVEVYHTDPKKKDTDGDSYADGYEVLNGFDPNGPGKLPVTGE